MKIMNYPQRMDKRLFWKFVNHRLKKKNIKIKSTHTLAIISIFFEEILNEIEDKKIYEFKNFMKITKRLSGIRKFIDINTKEQKFSSPKEIIFIHMPLKIKNKLIKYINFT